MCDCQRNFQFSGNEMSLSDIFTPYDHHECQLMRTVAATEYALEKCDPLGARKSHKNIQMF